MVALAKHISEAGYADRILTERHLATILKGSDASRYGLINRALKDGSLIRLKRGLYTLAPKLRRTALHPFAIAQAIVPGSYVSLETALAYHDWIPEAVYQTASITPGRKSSFFDHDVYGRFSFYPIAHNPYEFLRSVERIQLNGQTVLIASHLRALMDLVAYRKEVWKSLEELTSSLRIEPSQLLSLKRKDFNALKKVYKHKNVNDYLTALAQSTLKRRSTYQQSTR